MTTVIQADVDDTEPYVPTIDKEKIKRLGVTLMERFGQYERDRFEIELQWLKNVRQFRGIYDPEIERRIGDDQSRAYPKITRTKVIGTVARLMEMLFPQTEKNWGLAPSPLPNLSTADLQTVLDHLTDSAQPPQPGQPPIPPTNDAIEKAIFSFAKVKAEKMETQIEEQLDEVEYIQLARGIIFSAVVYCIGVLKGPMIKTIKSRSWSPDPYTGRLTAKEGDKLQPVWEQVPCWNYYPDLSAKNFDQIDGQFERHIMSRNQIRELAKRPDFMADQIKKWLQENTTGNYKERHWETMLRVKGDRKNVSINYTGRKYEWWEWWGTVSGHELKACGVEIPDEQLDLEVEANICGIGHMVIKAQVHPYDGRVKMYHQFVYEEDDINLMGTGLPMIVRDSQMAICEASRMLLDNASIVCGPILEMNYDLLMPGQDYDLYARKVYMRTGTGTDASQPAVRSIPLESHIQELSSIVTMFMGFADTETALPPPALGDVSGQGKEAYRTSSGTSMLLGAAALPIRDTVRNFDKFTTSFIESAVFWNMEFNQNDDIKGDYSVLARGSTSLVAKEVRSQTLAQFSQTLTPEERMYISTEKMLIERMKANDIPMDVLEEEDIVESKLQAQTQQAQQQATDQAQLIESQVKEQVTMAFKNIALANAASARTTTDSFNALVQGVTTAHEADQAAREGATDRGVSGAAGTGSSSSE